jgi:hypothetical protein
MAEQRRYREPVCQTADHRRLGKGAEETHGRVPRLGHARNNVERCHHEQQSRRDPSGLAATIGW